MEEILTKARRYCAYQERCTKQLKDKLDKWNVSDNNKGGILQQMKKEGFIDDHRFATIFARGKFKTRKWGRIRIKMELQARKIESAVIQEAIYAINDDEYLEVLKDLLETKLNDLKKEKNDYVKKSKAAQSMMRKGYEGDLIWVVLRELDKK